MVGSVRRGEAPADKLEAIEDIVITSYSDALRDAGVDTEAEIRDAYRLAIALRWHVVDEPRSQAAKDSFWELADSWRDRGFPRSP